MDANKNNSAGDEKASDTTEQSKTTRREFVGGLAVGSFFSGALVESDLAPSPSEVSQTDLLLLIRATEKPFLTASQAGAVLQVESVSARKRLDELSRKGVLESATQGGERLYWLSKGQPRGGAPLSNEQLREKFRQLRAECKGGH